MTKRIYLLFIALTLILPTFLGGFTVNAADANIKYNGADTKVSVTGFLGTTKDGSYVVDNIVAFNFLGLKNKQFNKFTINYSSSDVAKGTITYKTTTGYTLSEEFFLEKGSNLDFTTLMNETVITEDKELNSVMGIKPLQFTFEPIRENAKFAFKLNSLDIVVGERPVKGTKYIENDRFKIGVDLAWGGGINYIEDKKDGDDTIDNMLNSRDTGRLVQQSYYGTSSAPYECGTYGEQKWGYNPVQGGDQFNNKSKVLDFTVTEDTIYVKCRPLDWAKDNVPTFVYMENTYKLKDDYIEVDNRYIDFSTYDHRGASRHQELPAFYTISYLDKFTFYNGTKPWTDDTLTEKNDLPFWGDPKVQKQCYFTLDPSNKETWCSWNSSETGYGIGLYTPEIELFLAGRFEFNGSKHPKVQATNYVAPLITTTMKNFVPFEYSYIITTGDVSTIRNTFKSHKDEFNWKDKNAQVDNNSSANNIDYTPSAESDRVAQLEIIEEQVAQPTATPGIQSSPTGNGSEKSNTLFTLFIISGIVVVIIVVGIIIFVIWKSKKRQR